MAKIKIEDDGSYIQLSEVNLESVFPNLSSKTVIVCIKAYWPTRLELIPISMYHEVVPPPPLHFIRLPDNWLVPIYSPGWREALSVRLKSLIQEHNTLTQSVHWPLHLPFIDKQSYLVQYLSLAKLAVKKALSIGYYVNLISC